MNAKRLIMPILILLTLIHSVSAVPYTYEIGNTTVVSGFDYFPVEIYAFLMLIGIIFFILGLVTRYGWFFELFSFGFFMFCAYSTPMAATFTSDISYNESNISDYVVTPIVNTSLPSFFVWLCYGLSILSFFMFFIFLFNHMMNWLNLKKEPPMGDEFL